MDLKQCLKPLTYYCQPMHMNGEMNPDKNQTYANSFSIDNRSHYIAKQSSLQFQRKKRNVQQLYRLITFNNFYTTSKCHQLCYYIIYVALCYFSFSFRKCIEITFEIHNKKLEKMHVSNRAYLMNVFKNMRCCFMKE